jgi:hypothetical protein
VPGLAPGFSRRRSRVLSLAAERSGGRVVLILKFAHPLCEPFNFLLQQAVALVLLDDDRNEHIRLPSQSLKFFSLDVLFHTPITKYLSQKVQVFFAKIFPVMLSCTLNGYLDMSNNPSELYIFYLYD